jgi:hypothetical protein
MIRPRFSLGNDGWQSFNQGCLEYSPNCARFPDPHCWIGLRFPYGEVKETGVIGKAHPFWTLRPLRVIISAGEFVMTKIKKKPQPKERQQTRGMRLQQIAFIVIAVLVIASFIISLIA